MKLSFAAPESDLDGGGVRVLEGDFLGVHFDLNEGLDVDFVLDLLNFASHESLLCDLRGACVERGANLGSTLIFITV